MTSEWGDGVTSPIVVRGGRVVRSNLDLLCMRAAERRVAGLRTSMSVPNE